MSKPARRVTRDPDVVDADPDVVDADPAIDHSNCRRIGIFAIDAVDSMMHRMDPAAMFEVVNEAMGGCYVLVDVEFDHRRRAYLLFIAGSDMPVVAPGESIAEIGRRRGPDLVEPKQLE